MSNIKEIRQTQWGSSNTVPRGWERFRATTFLEFISAKIDRALQAIELINKVKLGNYSDYEIVTLTRDGLDSLIDARNYLDKLIDKCSQDAKYFSFQEMP